MLKRLLIAACTLLFAGSLLAATPAAKPHVLIATSLGEIEVELDPAKAPISVKNFLEYVDSGYYDGTLFHRVIPGFMVQTGGFSAGMQEKKTRAPIKNEADNGLLNERGTLAMARTGVVDSATSQFFINLTDNDFLNHGARDFGYAVFGKVVRGMGVVDQIAKVPTTRRNGFADVPSDDVVILSAKRLLSPAAGLIRRAQDGLLQKRAIMLYRRFERLIDPFRSASERMPPSEVLRFYVYFLRQVWPVFLALLVVGLIVALIEVALFSYLGRIVDLAQSTPSAEFFRVHANELIWMAVVALVLRPLFNALHDMLVHQSINPSMTNLIRWQNHRYVLKQSLGFFQNDFAGRIAQRIMQTGNSLRDSAVQVVDALWHVLIYTVSALVLFAEADWRLMIPLVLWVFAYVGALAYFVPQVKRRSVEASDSRSKLMGRIVDGYTNITTLKLFAHTRQEEDYAREAIGDQTLKSQRAGRVVTSMDVTITVMNGVLITGTTGLALWLWSQELISVGAIALATGLVIRINNMSGWIMWVVGGIFENIGQVQDGMQTIALPRKVVDREDAQPLRVERGEVEFEHIAFHYGKGSGVIRVST